MFAPRLFISAGIALIAIALGASGHGLWWLVGLVWGFGWMHDGRGSCRAARGRRDSVSGQPPAGGSVSPAPAEPDPTRDRHEAFPGR